MQLSLCSFLLAHSCRNAGLGCRHTSFLLWTYFLPGVDALPSCFGRTSFLVWTHFLPGVDTLPSWCGYTSFLVSMSSYKLSVFQHTGQYCCRQENELRWSIPGARTIDRNMGALRLPLSPPQLGKLRAMFRGGYGGVHPVSCISCFAVATFQFYYFFQVLFKFFFNKILISDKLSSVSLLVSADLRLMRGIPSLARRFHSTPAPGEPRKDTRE